MAIRNPSAALAALLDDFARSVAAARHERSADPRRGDDLEVVVTLA